MTIKILGQALNSPVPVELYTTPASKSAVISTLTICNLNDFASTVSVSISAGGASTSLKDYIYYNLLIPPNDTFAATFGITLAAGDVIRISATSGIFSFNLFGQEQEA